MGNFDFSAISESFPYLMHGLGYTIQLTVIACLGGIAFGTLLALARLSPYKPLYTLASGYVNLMRSIPLILVILWFYLLVPIVIKNIFGMDVPPRIGPDRSAYITFIMFEAAFFCEIMRAGIQSIPKGQVGAAYALGLNYRQAMWLIILPQAFRNMLPVLLTQTIILFQDTSLVYVLSVTDFLGAASKIAQRDGTIVEMYSFVAVVYLAMCFSLSMAVKALNKRTQIIR